MRFYSKVSNYKVVLKHGTPGNSVLGVPAINGKSVKFEGGVAVIPDTDLETIEALKSSPSYGLHFVSGEEDQMIDPFAKTRKDSEPVHIHQNLQHGSIASQQTSKPILDPQQQIAEAAKSLAADIAKEMVKNMLPDIVAKVKAEAGLVAAPSAEVAPKKSTKKKVEPAVEAATV